MKNLRGAYAALYVDVSKRISVLMMMIQEKEGVPPGQQSLCHMGKQLEGGREISSYKIMEDSTIHLGGRLLGGTRGHSPAGGDKGGRWQKDKAAVIVRPDTTPAWGRRTGHVSMRDALRSLEALGTLRKINTKEDGGVNRWREQMSRAITIVPPPMLAPLVG